MSNVWKIEQQKCNSDCHRTFSIPYRSAKNFLPGVKE